MGESQLLITFTTQNKLNETIEQIKKSYTICFNKIFVLENEEIKKELICSYNIDLNEQIKEDSIPSNTIGVHRKKTTNTLYTINALNYLVSALNDGKLDNKFNIPWDNYRNCILVTVKGQYKKIKTKLHSIIELEK